MHLTPLYIGLGLQLVALLIACLLSFLSGYQGFFSALWGGFGYLCASGLAVLLLKLRRQLVSRVSPFYIFQLEFFRLVLTVVLLCVPIFWHIDLVWWAFLLSLILVSNATVLIFLLPKKLAE